MQQPPPSDASAQPAGAPAEQPGRRRGSGGKAATIVVVLVILAGLAYAAFRIFGGVAGSPDVLDDKVPARSLFYATAYLDPGAGQKINLQAVADRFPALSGRDLGQTGNQGLEALTAQSGLSFNRDIEPWLGSQIAVAFEPPTAGEPGLAVLIDSKNDARARTGLARAEGSSAFGGGGTWSSQSYQGVEVRVHQSAPGIADRAYAIVEHTVVVSNEVDVVHDVVDTIQGRSPDLADDSNYRATVDHLPKSTLGLAYANVRDATQLFTGLSGGGASFSAASPASSAGGPQQLQPNPLAQLQAFRGFGMSLSAQPAGLELDLAVAFDPDKLTRQQRAALRDTGSPDRALEAVPRTAFGFVAISNLKDVVEGITQQAEQNPFIGGFIDRLHLQPVIDSLTGQAALEVGPGSLGPVSGALVIGTDDEVAMQRFLDGLATQLVGSSSPVPGGERAFTTETYKGETIHVAARSVPGQPDVTPAYAVAGGFGIVATSPDEVKAVIDAERGSNVSGSATFADARAQVSVGSQLLYVDGQSLLRAFGPQLQESMGSTFSTVVEPNLRPVKALVITGHQEQDATLGQLFVLIR